MKLKSKLQKCLTVCSSSWSNLPSNVLELIANRLEGEDVTHLRLVCKSWNTSLLANPITVPPLNSSPLKIPVKFISSLMFFLYRYEDDGTTNSSVVVSSIDVYILRRSNNDDGWLVGAEQLSSGKVRLVHPLTSVPIDKNALGIGNGKFPQLVRNLSPLRVSTGTSYKISSIDNDMKFFMGERCIPGRKVIFDWKNSDVNKSPNVPGGSHVVLFQGELIKRANDGSGHKAITSSFRIRSLDDFIMWNDSIVAVDRYGRLYGIDHKTMIVTNLLVPSSRLGNHNRRKQLLECNSQLYLVVQKQSRTDIGFEVYVLDCPNIMSSSWKKLTTLGDRVLFVGLDSCFFVESNDLGLLGRISGNCIVFTRDCFSSRCGNLFKKAPNEYLEIGVYDYTSGNLKLLSSDTTLSTAIWPPPRWFFESNDGDRPFRDEDTEANKTMKMEVKKPKKGQAKGKRRN